MIAHDSKSYPYLAIAQRYDVDYGVVLERLRQITVHHDKLNDQMDIDIWKTYRNEMYRVPA